MRRMITARWIVWSALLLGAAIALSTTATALSVCRSIKGKFVSQAVTGQACTSPIGLCTQGTLTGYLKGEFSFKATLLTITADTPTTSVALYTGDSVLTTARGDLSVKNAGALQTTDPGNFAEVDTITGGTGSLSGASGSLRFEGTFTQESGGSGTYAGQICTP